MEIKYSPSVDLHDLSNPSEIKNEFIRQLNSIRDIELKRCVTLIGPHRDDYEMELNGLNLKMFGSRDSKEPPCCLLNLQK